MVFHMKTTLNISDAVMKQLKATAASQGLTISQLVEAALWQFLNGRRKRAKPKPLPTFNGGKCFVDVADRDALYRAMER